MADETNMTNSRDNVNDILNDINEIVDMKIGNLRKHFELQLALKIKEIENHFDAKMRILLEKNKVPEDQKKSPECFKCKKM